MLCLIHSGPIPSVVRTKALNQNSITGHSIIKRHVQNIMCASVCPYLSDICFWHWATTDSTLSSRGGTCQTVAVASFVCFVLLLLSFKSWAKCWDKDSFVVVSWWAALCALLFGKTETLLSKWSMEKQNNSYCSCGVWKWVFNFP